jgi:hypothetical protein
MYKRQPFIRKTGNLDQEFYLVSYYDERGNERHYGNLYGDPYETIEEAQQAKLEFEKLIESKGF